MDRFSGRKESKAKGMRIMPCKYIISQCGSCGQKVERLNPQWARWNRKKSGVSMGQFAKDLGFTSSYLCDVELGRRNMTVELQEAYEGINP